MPATEWTLLRGLPAEDVRALLDTAARRTYRRSEAIFREGERANALHLIAEGRVGVQIGTIDGEVLTLAVLGPGDCVGELALVASTAERVATCVALERTVTLAVHRDHFAELRRRHPALTDGLVETLAETVRRLDRQLIEALRMPADARIRQHLAALAERYGTGGDGVEVRLTQEDLARVAGTTRSTVNRVLRDEAQRGTVELRRGRILVLDPERLAT